MYLSKYFSTRSRFDLMIIVNITNFCHASFNYNLYKYKSIVHFINYESNSEQTKYLFVYGIEKCTCVESYIIQHFSLTLANISKR